jgi:hypothetical protein
VDKETIDLIKKLAKDEKLASQMDYVRKMTDLAETVIELTEMVENVRRVKDYHVSPESNRFVTPPSIVPERFRSITEPLDYSLVREDLNSITTPRNYSLEQ